MRRTSTLFAGVAAALMLGAGTASAAPTPFGSDLAAAPVFTIGHGQTYVNNSGGSGAVPAGYVVPADGLITGWRIKSAGGDNLSLRFRVMRANTSIHLGPTLDIGPVGVSATFPESVLVKQGDRIGVTSPVGVGSSRFIVADNVPGATFDFWFSELGPSETRISDGPVNLRPVLIQADVDSALSVCGGVQATIAGTPGSETITGTAGNDVIVGLGGDDTVVGLGGDDIICGGDGNDKVKGGAGKDRLYGEAGRDKLRGGAAKDFCSGGADKDAIGCEKAKQN